MNPFLACNTLLGAFSIRVVLALSLGIPCIQAALPPVLNDPVEGQKLAAELRSMVPTENGKVSGVLKISSPTAPLREVQFTNVVTVLGTNWVSTYETREKGSLSETLIIRHFLTGPNEYEWRRGNEVLKLDPAQATNSFAGSDFALLNLGMDFFHWPTQLLSTREMRKSASCDVLESRPAKTNFYSRVLSWIEQKSRAQGQPGLLMAEAYDAKGKKLKEFEVNGFKKVAGQYQVREMEIRNRQTKGSTRLQFDFGQE